jgi:hypothetical protein
VLADDLGKRLPEDTVIRVNYLPTLRAQLSVTRNEAMKGIEVLQAALPYELGQSLVGDVTTNMYPCMCAAKPIELRIEAAKPKPSSRKSSTVLGLC